jgi:hypothetical protein
MGKGLLLNQILYILSIHVIPLHCQLANSFRTPVLSEVEGPHSALRSVERQRLLLLTLLRG